MRSAITFSIAALASLAAAQDTPQLNYPYTIDPDSVSSSDRDAWCLNQKSQCPLICLQQPGVTSMTTNENECDADTLQYSCVCENNVAPNVTEYSQTLPFYICQQWGNNCVKNCGLGASSCADKCRADHPCGAQSPYKGNSSIATMSTASATPSSTNKIPLTGFGGAQQTGASSSTQGSAAAGVFAPSAGMTLAALCGSVFLGFAVML
ncbi:hypothetical protein HBI56_127390 [Parastagonospora nodorum]|nr:hypothetical protein HBI06_155480 [Parastagonospora nodorum]KAH4249069.1 hypothetical protein HBI05_028190 [Parastagonospora nodorum]KAH4259397.1 hypothetical protein HBI03_137940 [Parastagonospora nodorum]KAH4281924.1 hypothetical protein HBI04_045210 [Parastagonospora nodorum]KAH4807819.1 hypothetical protein HBH61_125360 [Parastagonospora nodorum]